jgi:hypothetical protein
LPEVSVRSLTEDDKVKLKNRELTEDEVVALIMQPQPSESKTSDTQRSEAANNPSAPIASDPIGSGQTDEPMNPRQAETPDPEINENKARMAELIATIYVLRESMTNQLDGILESVKAEYISLPEEERTDAKKREIAMRAVAEASSLEHACDTQMNGILRELETLLKEAGRDLGVAAEIRQAYAEEKSLKKSYYLSLYS